MLGETYFSFLRYYLKSSYFYDFSSTAIWSVVKYSILLIQYEYEVNGTRKIKYHILELRNGRFLGIRCAENTRLMCYSGLFSNAGLSVWCRSWWAVPSGPFYFRQSTILFNSLILFSFFYMVASYFCSSDRTTCRLFILSWLSRWFNSLTFPLVLFII